MLRLNLVLNSSKYENLLKAPYFPHISFALLQESVASSKCALYLAPSLIPSAGRGIYAGTSFDEGDTVVVEQSLAVKYDDIVDTQLNNYVYNSEEDGYSMVVFGAACLFNHFNDPKDVAHFWDDEIVVPIKDQLSEAFANYTQIRYLAEKPIIAGKEIFVSYGRDSWFSERGMKFNTSSNHDAAIYDLGTLDKVGHCLTDIYIDESTIPMAGKGVFSTKSYKKGELISIAPTLQLPKHIMQHMTPECVIINYCITSEGSDMALLPLTLAAMMNHGGVAANVEIDWYDWSNKEKLTATLKKSPDELVDTFFAQLDLAYRASRDIAVGEELLVVYGHQWEEEWMSHLDRLSQWIDSSASIDPMQQHPSPSLENKPQFRHPIIAPEGLYPDSWESKCIGKTCTAAYLASSNSAIIKVDLEKKRIEEEKERKKRFEIDRITMSKAFGKEKFLSSRKGFDEL
eukprot:gene4480-8915_t